MGGNDLEGLMEYITINDLKSDVGEAFLQWLLCALKEPMQERPKYYVIASKKEYESGHVQHPMILTESELLRSKFEIKIDDITKIYCKKNEYRNKFLELMDIDIPSKEWDDLMQGNELVFTP